MSRVFWDSNLFIYLIEDYGTLSKLTVALAERMLGQNDQLYASTLTPGEVLTHPVGRGDAALSRKYEEILERNATLIPLDREAARVYASIRQDKSVKAPDAIQLACAAAARVDLFVTNDERLSQKSLSGIRIISSLQKALAFL